ncbi:MAG TPA: PLP-dependent aminotransferase family protein, partial [Egibacteraceae bacterium]
DEEGLIPEALAQALEYLAANGRRAKFLYTVPNHQNPAGVSLSPKRREQIVDLALTHNLLVVEDNPYGLLDFKGEVRTPLAALAPEQVIYVGTLSKILSPGLRVGWIAASPPIRDKLILLKEAADLSQSNLTQHIAERWFATQPWLEQIEAFREVYRERCDAMLEALATDFPPGCTWSVPTGGFFVWLRLPPGLNSGELLAQALNARVAYVPGRAFYADDSGSDAMRLSFCYPTPEQIRAGVARLAEVVREEIELVRAVYGDREP